MNRGRNIDTDIDGRRIGQSLQRERNIQERTVASLAKATGLKPETISEIEAGNVDSRLVEVFVMALDLDVDVEHLFSPRDSQVFRAARELKNLLNR